MTSADEFALQLLIDKGIVNTATVENARAKLSAEDDYGSADSAVLTALVKDHTLTPMQVAEVLAEEFNMEVVDLSDVRISAEKRSCGEHGDG